MQEASTLIANARQQMSLLTATGTHVTDCDIERFMRLLRITD